MSISSMRKSITAHQGKSKPLHSVEMISFLLHVNFFCHLHITLHLSLSWINTQKRPVSLILFFFLKEHPAALRRTSALKNHQTPLNLNPDVSHYFDPHPPVRRVALLYQMSLVLAPNARSPRVEKKSSISFSRSRLRFSASSRARSEFRSLISSMRCFFLSCSISCSKRSICAHRAALESSNLRDAAHQTVKERSVTPWLLACTYFHNSLNCFCIFSFIWCLAIAIVMQYSSLSPHATAPRLPKELFSALKYCNLISLYQIFGDPGRVL